MWIEPGCMARQTSHIYDNDENIASIATLRDRSTVQINTRTLKQNTGEKFEL